MTTCNYNSIDIPSELGVFSCPKCGATLIAGLPHVSDVSVVSDNELNMLALGDKKTRTEHIIDAVCSCLPS